MYQFVAIIIQVARWRVCNFAKIPHQYVLWMAKYNELKICLQKSVYKMYGKKKKNHAPAGFEPATSWSRSTDFFFASVWTLYID